MAASSARSKASERSKAISRRRHLARLAAVQALYQVEMTGQRPEAVVLEFLTHRRREEIEGISLEDLDQSLFNELVVTISKDPAGLDALLSGALSADWPVERLERLLRIIFRLGVYELRFRPKVPVGVIINECVDLAHAYYEGKEPGMVNGVLDRLARELRDGGPAAGQEEPSASQG